MKVLLGLIVSFLVRGWCESLSSRPAEFLSHSRGQLFDSTWPLDHGDSARSKFVLDAGLPKDVKVEDIKFVANTDLAGAQWLYTGGENSKYVYVIRGLAPHYVLNKLDSKTLEVLQSFDFDKSMYTGGMLMHRNGHVYAIYSNVLYAFWNGDLDNSTKRELPTSLNGRLTMTNGMLVTQDGFLVVKQWSWSFTDTNLALQASAMLQKLAMTIFVVCLVSKLLYSFRDTTTSLPVKIISSLLVAIVASVILFLVFLIANFRVQMGTFSIARFFTESFFSRNNGGGELKLIDPISLEVRAAIDLPERCSFARMALSQVTNADGDSEDAIVLLGDENVHQVRWRPSSGELYLIPEWSRNYRRNGEGSFPGTGPSIYNDTAYFTDNTFPIFLSKRSYSMFSMRINHIEKDGELIPIVPSKHYVASSALNFPPSDTIEHYTDIKNNFPALPKLSLVEQGSNTAGFMFWSVTVVPEMLDGDAGVALVWDSSGRTVQARELHDITKLRWIKRNVTQADCLTALPDKGHIYMTDYDMSPAHVNEWQSAIGKGKKYASATKFFLIVDAQTGEEIVRVPTPGQGMNPTLLVPGANNDLFLGTHTGVIRIYV